MYNKDKILLFSRDFLGPPPRFACRRLLPLVVELRTEVLVVVYFVELAPLRGWLSQLAAILGPPPPFGRRRLLPLVVELRTKVLVVVSQLAVTCFAASAPVGRVARPCSRLWRLWSAALPHCFTSLGQSLRSSRCTKSGDVDWGGAGLLGQILLGLLGHDSGR